MLNIKINTPFSLVVYLQSAIKIAIYSLFLLSHTLSPLVAIKQSAPQDKSDQPADQTGNYPTEKTR